MATTAAQNRASSKYNAKNTIQVCLRLNKTTDADVIKKLRDVDSKLGYIKKLIRDDITK